jgi:hypothetical protein
LKTAVLHRSAHISYAARAVSIFATGLLVLAATAVTIFWAAKTLARDMEEILTINTDKEIANV